MIDFFKNMNDIPIYTDEYLEEDKFLKGRKQGSNSYFIISNPKTANSLYQTFLIKQRKDKLNCINKIYNGNI